MSLFFHVPHNLHGKIEGKYIYVLMVSFLKQCLLYKFRKCSAYYHTAH